IGLYYFFIERYVQIKLLIGQFFYHNSSINIKFYYIKKQKWIYCSAENFINKFWLNTPYSKQVNQFSKFIIDIICYEVPIIFVLGTIASIIFFIIKGRKQIATNFIRGGKLVEPKVLAKMLYKAKAASLIKIAGLPLVKNSEGQHILLIGTTGSGKTNTLNILLPQLRSQGHRAIVVDMTGSFYNRFFDPRHDKLLNPFSENSVNWLPWNDCDKDFEFDALSSAFFKSNSLADKYWEETAQKVFSACLQKEKNNKSINSLISILAKASLNDFCKYFENTFVAGLVTKEADKTTASIRSMLLNKIDRLKYLKEGGNFSIKKWVNEGEGWLFILAPPNQQDTLRPLISAWIDIVIKGLMDRPPEAINEKLFVISDELPANQEIPSLKRGLAEIRKYGGCFIAGIQNIFQLEEIYGQAGAWSLLDMFNTKFFFKVGDQRTAEYVSKTLGDQEIFETKQSLSYGSNNVRDGVNLNSSERIIPLVLPTEVLNLPTRTCYVKLAENYPITKLEMKLQI
ncbi:MAG: type IV secretion system DNA-binding domain-containing protein, partial [Rickettsia endosymbiont of Oxypoda opaca]|nr:type IV secretion system DNA-binding domain-containing protein [Rickettsia endosymbiont of Oxypoda opaca]